jgi:hypothetical protein
MHIKEYLKPWLVGVGRADLARKVDRDEIPELYDAESSQVFARFQKGEITPNEVLQEIFGI